MRALIIGNSRTWEMVGDLAALTSHRLRGGGCAAPRMLWSARDGDVLVMPFAPPADYPKCTLRPVETRASSPTIVILLFGSLGSDVLIPDRLTDPSFVDDLCRIWGIRRPAENLAISEGVSVTGLARTLGAEAALPSYPFSGPGAGGVSRGSSRSCGWGPVPAGSSRTGRRRPR